MSVGMELVVIVIQPTPDIPMLIRRATVRWAKGKILGLLFPTFHRNRNPNSKPWQSHASWLWSCLN